MSDKNTNTDNTDEPTKAELHERVQQLESTVAKMMPSRRDALKLGAAGIAGAAGLSAASQSADAATGSAGQIGDPNNRPDLFADEVDANTVTGLFSGAYSDETANRSRNKTFTNSGSPLFVSVGFTSQSSGASIDENIRVNGLTVTKIEKTMDNTGEDVFLQAIIPAGADYEVASFSGSNVVIRSWVEL